MATRKLFTLPTSLSIGIRLQNARFLSSTPQHNATLKDVRLKLKSIKNIQKITKTMQMVSAAKYSRAERELKPARIYGDGALALGEKAGLEADESKPNHLIVAISSDRGLCGGVHSGIGKAIKSIYAEQGSDTNTKLVLCGEKIKSILVRTNPNDILFSISEVGRKPPMFEEAAFLAEEVLNCGYEFDVCKMYYNKFRNIMSYKMTPQDIFSFETLSTAETMLQYDSVDADVLSNYHEFSTANVIYLGMKEQACSEQSARMTAMDSATKNAGDMIKRLQIVYNRTRQSVITTELIEIISGCVALESKD